MKLKIGRWFALAFITTVIVGILLKSTGGENVLIHHGIQKICTMSQNFQWDQTKMLTDVEAEFREKVAGSFMSARAKEIYNDSRNQEFGHKWDSFKKKASETGLADFSCPSLCRILEDRYLARQRAEPEKYPLQIKCD